MQKTFVNILIVLAVCLLIKCDPVFAALSGDEQTERIDTAYINRLNEAAFEKRKSDMDSSYAMAMRAIQLSEEIDYPFGKAHALVIAANYKSSTSDVYTAMGDFNAALEIFRKLLESTPGDSAVNLKMAFAHNLIGIAYLRQANHPEALKNLLTALKLREENGDLKGVSYTQNNLGVLQMDQGKYRESIQWFQPSLKIREQLGDTAGMAISNNNIGSAYQEMGILDTAIFYYNKCKELCLMTGDSAGLSLAQMNIGIGYQYMGKYEDALVNLFAAQRNIAELINKVKILLNISEIYFAQGKMAESEEYAQKSLQLALQIGNYEFIRKGYLALSQTDSVSGNFSRALQHYKLSVIYNDSIHNEENTRKMVQTQMQYDFDKQIAIAEAEQEKKDIRQRTIRNSITGVLAGALLFLGLVYRQRNKIAGERKRSDALLLNILPAETAEELKSTGSTKAKHFAEATVLFTDFRNFTSMAERLTPQELVNEIHHCYSEFDRITQKYGIEKIKTIGDSYMCAGGVPVSNSTSALDVVSAALDIRDFMFEERQKREAAGLPFFEIRIGCHTGPVVAGIVGIKKFAYDIWGDTVNIASRMESSGDPGKVNISGSTYDKVKDLFHCTHRGKVSAKNKGEIDMYFAERKT